MPRFRKKPVEIEAMQWDGTAAGATHIINWVLDGNGTARYHDVPSGESCPTRFAHTDQGGPHRYCSCGWAEGGDTIVIDTREGAMAAASGDWVIREPYPTDDRCFYPCKPDIFAQTYEPVTVTTYSWSE